MDKWFAQRAQEGNYYRASNSVATATTALAATHTGLVLSNPVTSSKDLVVREVSFVGSTAEIAVSFLGLATGPSITSTNVVHTTAVPLHNGREQGSDVSSGSGLVDESATLPDTPVNLVGLANVLSAVGATGVNQLSYKFNGTLILQPGAYLASHHISQVFTGYFTFEWAEIDVNGAIS